MAEVVSRYMQREGYSVRHVADGARAMAAVDSFHPDLVILDVMLPNRDGLEICRELRATHAGTPVIMLTARGEETDKILGLGLGADDYVTKPFVPREMVARVKAILRRARPTHPEPASELFDFGDLTIDLAKRDVRLGGETITLRAKEFDLLVEMARRPGVVFSREKLLQDVWGYDFFGDSGTIDVHVRRLRAKLNDDSSNPRFIETVWGVGYRFKEQRTHRS